MRFVYILLAISMVLLVILLGGELHLFVHAPSLCLVFGYAFAFMFFHHPPKETKNALSAALFHKALEPKKAAYYHHILTNARAITTSGGIVGWLIGSVHMLFTLNDKTAIGPHLATAFLSLIYAVIAAEILLSPLLNRLSKHMDNAISN